MLGLSSAKTGDEIKSQAEQSIHRRKRGSNWFSHLISFHPQFWICLACSFTAAHVLHYIKSLIRWLSSCKSWPNAWFHWNHTQFCSFFCYMKIGDETGVKGFRVQQVLILQRYMAKISIIPWGLKCAVFCVTWANIKTRIVMHETSTFLPISWSKEIGACKKRLLKEWRIMKSFCPTKNK